MKTIPHASVTAGFLFTGLAAFRTFQCWAAMGVLFFGVSPIMAVAAPERPLVYEAADLDQPPTPKREVRIRFSRAQRKANAEIKVRFVVTTDGKTARIVIVKFSDPELVGPAFEAYQAAEYIPGMKDGLPVNSWVEVVAKAE